MAAAKKPKKEQRARKKTVLFVCTGNTCRSPMAEAVLKHYLKERGLTGYRVSSAGLAAEPGAPMSEGAKAALRQLKIPAGAHKARQLTATALSRADLVVCMTPRHKAAVGGKAVTLAEITGGNDVADPYGQSVEVYRAVADYFVYAAPEIIDRLESEATEAGQNQFD